MDPTIHVASSLSVADTIISLLNDPAVIANIQNVNYADNYVLVVFRGVTWDFAGLKPVVAQYYN